MRYAADSCRLRSGSYSAARAGFSLIELLVVIGLLGVLVGLLMPAVQRVREAASRASCLNNLRQIGLALTGFHDTYGQLPPLPARGAIGDPNAILSWRALILPYIEQNNLWAVTEAACRAQSDPWQNPPHVALDTVIKLFVCPSDGRLFASQSGPNAIRATLTSYIGVAGGRFQWNGMLGMPGPGIQFRSVTDGLSNTLMVGERPPPDTYESGQWYPGGWQPDMGLPVVLASVPRENCEGPFQYGPGRTDNRCDQFHFWSLHSGGGNFLVADCSARFIPYTAESIMSALATRGGGEPVSLPE
jgi:prepilin-type N-terminal cleavage/methylation domain-containing protein